MNDIENTTGGSNSEKSSQLATGRIKKLMAEILRQPEHRLKDDVELNDLVNDSFILVDMIIEIQDELSVIIVQQDLRRIKTVGDLVTLLTAKQNEKREASLKG